MSRRLRWIAAVAFAAACAPAGDHRPPRIVDGPSVEADDDGTAIVRWRTDERSDGTVQYGSDEGYGIDAKDARYALEHELVIAPLAFDATYHLRLEAWDVWGNGPTITGDVTFSTPPAPPPAQLVITEVMYAPRLASSGEFVEIYDAGSTSVDLGTGFRISDGDSSDPLVGFSAGTTLLAPGAYALLLDPDYAGDYQIPDGVVRVTTPDHTIGNGLASTDPVTLFGPGNATPLSTYSAEITTAPDGTSVERSSPDAPDDPAGWSLSADPSGSSPGRANAGGP